MDTEHLSLQKQVADNWFEPEFPTGHLKYQKSRIVAWFPIKTSAKCYDLTVGAQGQLKWVKVA